MSWRACPKPRSPSPWTSSRSWERYSTRRRFEREINTCTKPSSSTSSWDTPGQTPWMPSAGEGKLDDLGDPVWDLETLSTKRPKRPVWAFAWATV